MRQELDADIRAAYPYDERGFRDALERLLLNPRLPAFVQTLFPGFDFEAFVRMARSIENVGEFQARVIAPAINSLLRETSGGVTVTGLEALPRDRRVLFVSNHRDIVCDPAILANCLFMDGRETPKICLGDNLLVSPWAADLVRMNKGVTVRRNLPPRELLRFSHALSALIRREIADGPDSVWVAQREGRSKNGDDRTHPGLLKMLALEGEGEPLERLRELRIVPVAISYELDPCDLLKAREILITERLGEYVKSAGEDVESMTRGVYGSKGRIHFHFGSEISASLERLADLSSRRAQLDAAAAEIDRQIHLGYRCWPSHFIAYDRIEGGREMQDLYSLEEREEFAARLEKRLRLPEIPEADRPELEARILEAYANPVRNALALHGGATAAASASLRAAAALAAEPALAGSRSHRFGSPDLERPQARRGN